MNTIHIGFDTETNGIPEMLGYKKFYNPKDIYKYNTSRMVQIAYQIYNGDMTKLLDEKNYLIKPNGFVNMNTEFHGITYEKAMKEGRELKDVLNEFLLDIINYSKHFQVFLFGHNVDFDINITLSELYRMGNIEGATILSTVQKRCTMELSRNIVKKEFILKNGKKVIKDPSLKEAFEFFTKENITNQHDALYDVKNTSRVYINLI